MRRRLIITPGLDARHDIWENTEAGKRCDGWKPVRECFFIEWMTELISTELYADRRLSVCSRSIYEAARFLPPVSQTALVERCGYSHSAASRASVELVSTGWAKTCLAGREKRLLLTAPEYVQLKQAELFEKAYRMQRLKGEFLTKVLLDAFVSSRVFIDNARPTWLVSPITGEPLEIDRLYFTLTFGPDLRDFERAMRAVGDTGAYGFEHHGAQHFMTTPRYPDPDELKKTMARDLVKKGRCVELGITLVVVSYRDLSPQSIVKKIPKGLPRGRPDLEGKYMEKVAEICSEYRANAHEMW